MKNFIAILLAVVVLAGIGVYFLTRGTSYNANVPSNQQTTTTTEQNNQSQKQATTSTPKLKADATSTVIGSSAKGNDIVAYHYGTGAKQIVFVGGIHGGYEWNTSLLAFQLMDYLKENPDAVPSNETVTVIPVLNPDGLKAVVGSVSRFSASDVPATEAATVPGRFNGNNVDLNRNFDCDWQASGVWQNKTVSGGTAAFSEPESAAMRDYINTLEPDAVIVYYSAAGGVYASNCHNGILPQTNVLTSLYADASGYPANEDFDFYKITGDMVNWLAKNNIPAISVLLTNHTDTEWAKNKAGVQAVLDHYAQ